jgi:regulatory protein
VRADARPARSPGNDEDVARRPRADRDFTASSDDQLEPEADPAAVARAICVRLLAARSRTRSELATAMRKRAVPDDVAASVLDRFTELGFIDDEAFAHAWVQSRQSGRGLAGRALMHELRSRGIDNDIAQEALSRIEPAAELAKARELVRRRLASMTGVPAEARYRRLTGMLARKGYPGNIATQAVREALAVDPAQGWEVAEPEAE